MSENIHEATLIRAQSKVDPVTRERTVMATFQVGRKLKRFTAKGPRAMRAMASIEEMARAANLDPGVLGPTHAELDALEAMQE